MATTTLPAAQGYLTRETLAGAAQFTGAVGAGGFVFNAVDTFLATVNRVPRILMLGYTALGAPHEVSIYLARDTTVGNTERIRLGGSRIKDDGTLSLTKEATIGCCCLGSPAVVTAGSLTGYYMLQIISSGKTGDATWTAWWETSAHV